jgi:hypothetical protein
MHVLSHSVKWLHCSSSNFNMPNIMALGITFIDLQKVMIADHHDRGCWERYFEPCYVYWVTVKNESQNIDSCIFKYS